MALRPLHVSRTLRLAILMASIALTACGGGGGGGSLTGPGTPTGDDDSSNEPGTSTGETTTGGDTSDGTVTEPPEETVAISGKVTFDLVSHQAGSPGLDYQNVQQVPARGVVVRLQDSAGTTLATGATDASGAYSLPAPVDTDVRVRVEASMQQAGAPGWAFTVHDNTQSNALYVLDGQLASSGTENSIRDLHAPSGWDGSGYTADGRSAAPFAILDTVREAVGQVVAVDADIQLPAMRVYWSGNNIAVDGDESNGEIGTSFYTPGEVSIYLLGDEDNDTDEYDRSVISHEFAHYLEDQISRTESIGGMHTGGSQLDMRVAFSEGLGNAFAGIATGDSVYRDSFGNDQASGMSFDVASNESGNHGWYSESSVQTIVYSLFDQNAGFGPIYRTLTGSSFLDFDGAASIYSFVAALRASAEADEQLIDSLLTAENISGTDGYGTSETNDAGSSITLPVYKTLAFGGSQDVCSDRQSGEYNGVDVRRFVKFTVENSGNYTVSVARSSGLTDTDPDFTLWEKGQLLAVADSSSADLEELNHDFEVGKTYWLEIYEYTNTDGETSDEDTLVQPKPQACFTVSLGNAS